MADYDQALELDPNDAPALLHRGKIHRMSGDYQHAIADIGATIRLDPDNAHAYHLRGSMCYEQYMGASEWIRKDDLERAIADFSQLIRLEPTSGTGYYLRGQAHSINGDRDRAIADLIEGSKVDPVHLGIRHLLQELKPDYVPPKQSLLELLNASR